MGSHPDLDINGSPSPLPDFQGFNRLDVAISSNLIVPTGTFTVQRLAIEFMLPVYQITYGKNRWHLDGEDGSLPSSAALPFFGVDGVGKVLVFLS